MDKKYIIFDFDGTMVNTNDVIVASWQATYEKYLGIHVSRREIEASFGETLVGTIKRKIPGAPVNEAADYYRTWQEEHQLGMVYVFKGVRELIDELKRCGCVLGIGTSRTGSSLRAYLTQLGLEDVPDAIVTMEDVTHHKPHPETALAVLGKMAGVPAGEQIPADVLKQAIMIGDSKYDIGCASNAGIDSVLTTWGRDIPAEEIATWDWSPTYVISSPELLLTLQ